MKNLSETKYKRVLLKLSGEVLAGSKETGIDFDKTLEETETWLEELTQAGKLHRTTTGLYEIVKHSTTTTWHKTLPTSRHTHTTPTDDQRASPTHRLNTQPCHK